ncbi:3149_t:CDS:2 [Dentiscutata heterogama]|uniref:3149_t:CDS:1 n=1 Tax=Dentiscutata heterogama TaxID=1316150 RepID=A0ACA9JYY6_9GLOM|nr:3149_t:CDS:2 [Dentiscutata heterogama]
MINVLDNIIALELIIDDLRYGSLSDSKLQPVYIYSIPKNQDTELSMHHACPLWLDTVKESNFTRKRQEEKYLNSFISTISRRISDRLKIQPPLDPVHVDYIYRACSFAVSFSNKYDTWCSLLEKSDFLQLEYLLDLGDYYSYSYGYQLNSKLACRFFTSFVESVESYLTGRSQVKSTLKFAHAETIMFLATMLGLYEDNYPLTADTLPQQISSRKFRTSKLVPFTANVYFEIYNCSTRYDADPTFGTTLIQLMVNEKPTSNSVITVKDLKFDLHYEQPIKIKNLLTDGHITINIPKIIFNSV